MNADVRAVADDVLGAASLTILVVRPDAYIGLRSDGADTESIRRYLDLIHDGASSRPLS